MTAEKLRLFIAIEDALRREGACFEDLCEAYAEAFREDAVKETHPTVKAALESAADALQSAGMDWYVSTK